MHQSQKDTQLALEAAKIIIDGRDPDKQMGEILVTLDGLVALILLTVMKQDYRQANAMLHEGLIPGIENRLSLYASRTR